MAEELKKRKNVRAGQKGQVTKVLTVCNEILESFKPSQENRLRQQKIALDERLELLNSWIIKFWNTYLLKVKLKRKLKVLHSAENQNQ